MQTLFLSTIFCHEPTLEREREREIEREKTELISFDILCKVRTKDQRMGAILRMRA
jgi:hypothetical protein